MRYIIGLLAFGSLVVGMFGVGLGNRALVILSAVMLLAFLILCVLDALLGSYKGVKGNPIFNWVVPSRFAKKPKKDEIK